MAAIVKCPVCGATDFDLHRYDSMMVLCSQLALFNLRCPSCGASVSSVCSIPADLAGDIESAASEVGAGMGRETPSR
jgi:rRNA maturation protein Nop10